MRAPPAVSVICGPGWGWRLFQALLGGCAGASLGAWCGLTFVTVKSGIAPAAVGAAVGATVFAAFFAAATWWLSAQPGMRLAWTGAEWRLSPSAEVSEGQVVAAPVVMMDLGPWMLMRVNLPSGHTTAWLGLGRRAAGVSWHLFRAAVYSFETKPSPLPSEQKTPF